ncbi:MAG: hypothetical protein M1820_010165 [Bogoriella megaspora]|nr:MAG: hypothetical protein M1820_010165 [Bogoriella megaspora]
MDITLSPKRRLVVKLKGQTLVPFAELLERLAEGGLGLDAWISKLIVQSDLIKWKQLVLDDRDGSSKALRLVQRMTPADFQELVVKTCVSSHGISLKRSGSYNKLWQKRYDFSHQDTRATEAIWVAACRGLFGAIEQLHVRESLQRLAFLRSLHIHSRYANSRDEVETIYRECFVALLAIFKDFHEHGYENVLKGIVGGGSTRSNKRGRSEGRGYNPRKKTRALKYQRPMLAQDTYLIEAHDKGEDDTSGSARLDTGANQLKKQTAIVSQESPIDESHAAVAQSSLVNFFDIIRSIQDQVQQLTDIQREIETRNSTLKTRLGAALKETENTMAEKRRSMEQLQETASALEKAKECTRMLKTELKAQLGDLQELRKENRSLQRQHANKAYALNEANHETEICKAELDNLRCEKSNLMLTQDSTNAKLQKAEEDLTTRTGELGNAQREITVLKQEHLQMRVTISDRDASLAIKDRIIDELRATERAAAETKINLENQVKDQTHKTSRIQTDLNNMERRDETRQRELREACLTLEDFKSQSEEDRKQLERQVDEEKTKNSRLVADKRVLLADNGGLKCENSKILRQMKACEERVEEIDTLADKLKDSEAKTARLETDLNAVKAVKKQHDIEGRSNNDPAATDSLPALEDMRTELCEVKLALDGTRAALLRSVQMAGAVLKSSKMLIIHARALASNHTVMKTRRAAAESAESEANKLVSLLRDYKLLGSPNQENNTDSQAAKSRTKKNVAYDDAMDDEE